MKNIESGNYDVKDIHNEYEYCNTWVIINVDLSSFVGKQKRINITLPDILIDKIDNAVKTAEFFYKDRSNFLTEVTINKLAAQNRIRSSFWGIKKLPLS